MTMPLLIIVYETRICAVYYGPITHCLNKVLILPGSVQHWIQTCDDPEWTGSRERGPGRAQHCVTVKPTSCPQWIPWRSVRLRRLESQLTGWVCEQEMCLIYVPRSHLLLCECKYKAWTHQYTTLCFCFEFYHILTLYTLTILNLLHHNKIN